MRTEREFINDITEQINASSVRRPHAVTFNGLVAYEMGPIALSDISAGLRAKPWRIRVLANDVFLTKSNVDNSAWEEEVLLFSYVGVTGSEFDLAFDQNGAAVVVWEQLGVVSIYCYDTIAVDYIIKELGPGRTPRASIDNILYDEEQNSDILVFYINDVDNRVDYRAQRDRYDIIYDTDIVDVTNKYLELLTPALNSRLYLWYTEYNPITDNYDINYWHSSIYPQPTTVLPISLLGDSIEGVSSRTTVFNLVMDDAEQSLMGDTIVSFVSRSTMTLHSIDDEEQSLMGDTIVSFDSRNTMILIDIIKVGLDSDVELGVNELLSCTSRVSIYEFVLDEESIELGNNTILSATKI